MRVVSNSSPVIALFGIGQESLMAGLFGVVWVPPSVRDEVKSGGIEMPAWARVQAVALTPAAPIIPPTLGAGERDAILLAYEFSDSLLVMDDRAGRQTAAKLGIRLTGTLGLILLGKERGLLSKVRPLLSSLRDGGFYLSDPVIKLVCERAGE